MLIFNFEYIASKTSFFWRSEIWFNKNV